MALYLSPLVDINEIDLTTTITAVATSIGAIVLRNTWKGPEKKQTLVTSVDELIETFGKPTLTVYEDVLSATGFLKYGSVLYCTRVMPSGATFSGVYGTPADTGTMTAYTTAAGDAYMLSDLASEDPDEFGDETIVFDAARADTGETLSVIAKSRGTWGNYTKVAIIGRDTFNSVRAGTDTYTTIGISSDLYDDISGSADVLFDNDYQFLVMVRAANQTQINTSPIPYSVVETFLVSTNTSEIDDEGTSRFCETAINSTSDYIRVALASSHQNTDYSTFFTADYTTLGGGSAGGTISDVDILAGYELYKNSEEIDVNILIHSGKSMNIISATDDGLQAICESRKDCMAVVDVPKSVVVNNKGNEATDCRDIRLGNHSTTAYNININTSYVAMYANWLNVYDKWNGVYRWIPSSGHVAGIYANTDNVSDPWFAPAGLNRAIIASVRKLAWNPTKGERDTLYKNGMNPIVSFAGQGKVVWGQKNMLDKSSAFNRVNVRRLFIIMAKSISTALKYFLFEPNDGFTRIQIINLIEPFLRDVEARRGIYDYLVVCDDRNNTPERIARNELWCDIYVKPTIAAEYIVLNLVATKTGASFTELVSSTA